MILLLAVIAGIILEAVKKKRKSREYPV